MAIERHDYRGRSPQKYGKPGITFPWGDTNFPRIVEMRTARKGDPTSQPIPFLTNYRDQASYPGAVLTEQTSDPGDDTDKNITETYEVLPGVVLTEIVEHRGIPILISRQRVARTAVFANLGEFQPAVINVLSITIGAQVTVKTQTPHDLPIGAWVVFIGTNSTPAIDGTLQILNVPSANQMIVTPASPVTIAGTNSGTMQSKNIVVREIKTTDNYAVKMKVESIVAVPDVGIYDFDVQTEENYAYPDFLEAINLYRDLGQGGSNVDGNPLVFSFSLTGGGVIGLPIQAGYRGPNPGSRKKRFYFVGVPQNSFEASWTPTIIVPSRGTYAIEAFSYVYGQSSDIGGSNTAKNYSVSNNWRPGTIPPVITGPSPAIANASNIVNLAITSIATVMAGNSPVITVSSTSSLRATMWITITKSNSVPIINGVWQVATVLSSTTFDLTLTTQAAINISTAGTSGNVAVGGAIAVAELDLPQSNPPMIVGQLSVSSITASSNPVITLTGSPTSGVHYWQPGMYVQFSGTNSTPALETSAPDGMYQIATVPNPNQITLISPPTVTIAGTAAGTVNGFITIMGEPEKENIAGLWLWEVRLIKIRYTSGQEP